MCLRKDILAELTGTENCTVRCNILYPACEIASSLDDNGLTMKLISHREAIGSCHTSNDMTRMADPILSKVPKGKGLTGKDVCLSVLMYGQMF